MKKILSTFLASAALAILLIGGALQAVATTGFIPGSIWYSKDTFFAGESIRIYSAVFNGSEETISGTVVFHDNGERIDEAHFPLLAKGSTSVVSVVWDAEAGNHRISAKIVEVTGSEAAEAMIASKETGEDALYIDRDTDRDGIGDAEDSDDDGDGISDEMEIENGTDPTDSDTDGDGIPDNEDPAPLKKANVDSEADVAEPDAESDASETEEGNPYIEKITNIARTTIDTINSFTKDKKQRIDEIKESVERSLDAEGAPLETEIVRIDIPGIGKNVNVDIGDAEGAAAERVDGATRVVKEGYIFLLALVSYVLGNTVLFYVFAIGLLYICYRLIKRRFGGRDVS
jgi:hypothetical protein